MTEAATEQIPESETALLDELTCRRALVQLYDGRPSAALETLDGMPDAARLGALRDPSAGSLGADEARAQILWATPGIPALALNGRTTEAIELAQLAYQLHSTLPGDIALTSPETHLLTLCVALQEHGALQEAQDLAITGFEASVAAGVLTGQTWFALSLARTSLIRAQPAIGRRWCDEAATLTESSGWRGPRMMALTGSAAMSALAGDVARAERALTESASDLVEVNMDEDADEGDPLSVDSAVGDSWQSWTDEGGDTGYAIEYGDQTLLVYGSAPAEDLQEFITLLEP